MLKWQPKGEDEEEPQIFGLHPGDLGVVAIAALFSIACLLVLILPSPFARLERMQDQAAKTATRQAHIARQKAIDRAVASGEVSVGIAPAQK